MWWNFSGPHRFSGTTMSFISFSSITSTLSSFLTTSFKSLSAYLPLAKPSDFMNYLTARAPSLDHHFLSSVFEGSLELATDRHNAQGTILELHHYRKSNHPTLPLTPKSALLLLECHENGRMVDESLRLFRKLHRSSKSTETADQLLRVLVKSGRDNDALYVLDEMLQPDSASPPSDFTGEIVFEELVKRERSVRSVVDEETVKLVTKLGEHGIFPDRSELTQMMTNLCGKRKFSVAWGVLHCVMTLGGVVEASSWNALLKGLGRGVDIERLNKLLVEMEERKIQPSVISFEILVNHLCKFGRVHEALQVFVKLRGGGENNRVGVEPDVVLFNTLIDGLCKVGRKEDGLSLLEEMNTRNKRRPNSITYNCLIDAFFKAGNVDKA